MNSPEGTVADGSGPGREDAAERRQRAVIAGHRGDIDTARALLGDDDPTVRAAAFGALARAGELTEPQLQAALADPEPSVRRRAVELAASRPRPQLVPLLDDPDPAVVEVAAWACGERSPAETGAVDALARVATDHPDPLCREAAVAALGALGAAAGLPVILAALGDRPAVRRRAVLALAPFDGPEVEAALRRALDDRDWQVRQAAADLLDQPPPG